MQERTSMNTHERLNELGKLMIELDAPGADNARRHMQASLLKA